MSGKVDPIRVQLGANELLLSAVVIRLMRLDHGFAQDARQWFDTLFGHFSASRDAGEVNPEAISTLRNEYLRLLEQAETLARTPGAPAASQATKPKSLRRRIFEWFERG